MAQPQLGPYNTTYMEYTNPHFDSSDPRVWVWWPTSALQRSEVPAAPPSRHHPPHPHHARPNCNVTFADGTAGQKYPLVPYLHGVLGGDLDLLGYTALFGQMASYGFVVVGTFACNTARSFGRPPRAGAPRLDVCSLPPCASPRHPPPPPPFPFLQGCHDARNSSRWTACGGLLPLEPVGKGWDSYYSEAYKIIDWARNMSESSGDAVFKLIDFDAGAGVVGHSMGGQGAAMAGGAACTEQWGVKTVVLHHPAMGTVPWGNIGSNISVPVAAFTTAGDGIWPETRDIMSAFFSRGDGQAYVYRDEVGWSHLEPVLWPPIENPFLATFTAAWLKVILNGDRAAYYDLVRFRRGRPPPPDDGAA